MRAETRLYIQTATLAFISVFFLTLSLIFEADLWFTATLIVWFSLVIYTFSDIKRHFVFLCFMVSFFVFLLGREFCYNFMGLGRYYRYLEPYDDVTFLLLIISMVCMFLAYRFADSHVIRRQGAWFKVYRSDEADGGSRAVRGAVGGVASVSHGCVAASDVCASDGSASNIVRTRRTASGVQTDHLTDTRAWRFRTASMVAFYFCFACSMLEVYMQIRQARGTGYLEGYMAANASSLGVISYFSGFTVIALSIYLVTMPRKKWSVLALGCYEFYAVLTMLTGHRYTFIAISMYVMVYIVYRQRIESGWISRTMVLLIIVAIPFILVLMNVINAVRTGDVGGSGGGIIRSAVSFMDQQGGSVNCVKRVFFYHDRISDMQLTSFSNTRTVLFENALVRKLFDVRVYTGNSVENAFYGHYLSHRLSYLEYGNYYFLGHGTGSCYIAELYHDFGYIGVALGNLIYGYLLRRITDIGTGRFFRDGLLFATQYFIYLAPRGDFDGMIYGLFNLMSILGLIGVWALAQMLRKKHRRAAQVGLVRE